MKSVVNRKIYDVDSSYDIDRDISNIMEEAGDFTEVIVTVQLIYNEEINNG